MEVGVHIPHFGRLASPAFVPAFCRHAEAVGFDGLWAVEHLVVPHETASEYTLARAPVVVASDALRSTMGLNLEMTTTLAVAAAVTTTVRLGTSVAVLPLRNAVLNARQIASVDLYSGGRVVYGVGVGWLAEEAAALGMPWDRRGARSDEHVAILRAIWEADDGPVSFAGTFHSFPAIDPDPRPGRRIPILVGGHSPAALDRVARLGDGWIAHDMGPDRLADALGALRRACTDHGRDPADLWIVGSTPVGLDGAGGAPGMIDLLGRYADLGVHHLQVVVGGRTEPAMLDGLTRWADEVLPALR